MTVQDASDAMLTRYMLAVENAREYMRLSSECWTGFIPEWRRWERLRHIRFLAWRRLCEANEG